MMTSELFEGYAVNSRMVLGPQALQLKNEAVTRKNAEGTTCERKITELEQRCHDLEGQLVKTRGERNEEIQKLKKWINSCHSTIRRRQSRIEVLERQL